MVEIRFKAADLLTYVDAAKLLGVSRQTIYNWIKVGKLRPYEIGNNVFLHRLEIERLLERG